MIAPTESLGGNAVDINKLEKLCQRYDAECMMLEAGIAGLEADLEAVKQRHLARLKKQAGNVARAEAELVVALAKVLSTFLSIYCSHFFFFSRKKESTALPEFTSISRVAHSAEDKTLHSIKI